MSLKEAENEIEFPVILRVRLISSYTHLPWRSGIKFYKIIKSDCRVYILLSIQFFFPSGNLNSKQQKHRANISTDIWTNKFSIAKALVIPSKHALFSPILI